MKKHSDLFSEKQSSTSRNLGWQPLSPLKIDSVIQPEGVFKAWVGKKDTQIFCH